MLHLHRDLERMRRHLLEIGALVERSIRQAIAALRTRRTALASEVIEGDRTIDRLEIELEEECLKILALHQPVAADLRFIAACFKIDNDLERMGDLAANIAKTVPLLARQPEFALPDEFVLMTELVADMMRGSLDAFVNGDVETAREICRSDDKVDELHLAIVHALRDQMREDPGKVDCATSLLGVSSSLERIADHSTNIAEDVVYMVEGDIIRHPGRAQAKDQPTIESA